MHFINNTCSTNTTFTASRFSVMLKFTDDVNNGPDRNSSLSIIDLGNRIIHNLDCNQIYS